MTLFLNSAAIGTMMISKLMSCAAHASPRQRKSKKMNATVTSGKAAAIPPKVPLMPTVMVAHGILTYLRTVAGMTLMTSRHLTSAALASTPISITKRRSPMMVVS